MRRGDVDNLLWLTSPAGVRHQPGLDGVRGLAVAAVVVFHTGLGWLPGGYLGVSMFFTLSGVVIGTVILQEVHATRELSLRRFWSRRARRLLPVAWFVLAAVAVARLLSARLSATSTGDVLASWLHVANWHFLADDASYGDLFAGPSAVLHFWSLAIEEQFYVAVGLLALFVATVSKRPANLLGAIAAVGALVSFALPFLFSMSVDRVYYGTDTRAGELFSGLALAAVLSSPVWRQRIIRRTRPIALVGTVALLGSILAWATVSQTSSSITSGLLPLVTVASSLVALAALVPHGPVWRLTTLPPLRRLGAVSYGLYLVHWPIFVVVEQVAPTWPVRHVVGIALALAAALGSARLLETPVRRRTLALRPTLAAGVATAVVLVGALALPARRTAADELLETLEARAEEPLQPEAGLVVRPSSTARPTTAPATARAPTGEAPTITAAQPTTKTPRTSTTSTTMSPTTTAATSTTVAVAAPVVGVFGDSIALSLALALNFTAGARRFQLGEGVADVGCGVALSPYPQPQRPPQCSDNDELMTRAVQQHGIEIAVVMSCQWEMVEQTIPGDTVPRIPGDPVFDGFVRDRYLHVVDVLRAAGARRVLWVRCPRPSSTVGVEILEPIYRASRDPARVARINQLVDEIDAQRDDVDVLDLAAWVDAREADATLRPDGSHYEFEQDTGVAAEMTRLIEAAL